MHKSGGGVILGSCDIGKRVRGKDLGEFNLGQNKEGWGNEDLNARSMEMGMVDARVKGT